MSSEPLWAQTAGQISAQISHDGLAPGAKMPPERDLCARLNVSRVTLRKALAELEERGLVKSSHGRGWFVAAPMSAREWPESLESFSVTAHRKNMRPGSIILAQDIRLASLDEAERLNLPAGTPLFHLDRVRLLNDIRVAIDRTVLPLSFAPDLTTTDFTSSSLFDELRARGLELRRAEATIEARPASEELAQHLGLTAGAPVLFLDQTIYTSDQRPVLLSTVEYSGERYRLRTTFRA